jgi:hypothetical protein
MPSMPDLLNKLTTVQGIASAALTTTTTGTGVSMAGQEKGVYVQIDLGVVTGTTPTCVVKLQQSSNDNTADASGAADAYADVTGATISLTDANASGVTGFMCYNYDEKYLRAVATIAGTNPTFNTSVTLSTNQKS